MYNPKIPYSPLSTYKRNYPKYYENTSCKKNIKYSDNNDTKQEKDNTEKFEENKKRTETRSNNNLFQFNTDEVLFEIFGLKLYFDDILIICILLFLYQEKINDEYLFICLILLLLS